MVEPDKERTLGLPSIPPGTCLGQLLLEGLPGLTFCHRFLLALLGYGLPCFQILTSSHCTDSAFDPRHVAHSHGLHSRVGKEPGRKEASALG